jgi:hypothetical protein
VLSSDLARALRRGAKPPQSAAAAAADPGVEPAWIRTDAPVRTLARLRVCVHHIFGVTLSRRPTCNLALGQLQHHLIFHPAAPPYPARRPQKPGAKPNEPFIVTPNEAHVAPSVMVWVSDFFGGDLVEQVMMVIGRSGARQRNAIQNAMQGMQDTLMAALLSLCACPQRCPTAHPTDPTYVPLCACPVLVM